MEFSTKDVRIFIFKKISFDSYFTIKKIQNGLQTQHTNYLACKKKSSISKQAVSMGHWKQ